MGISEPLCVNIMSFLQGFKLVPVSFYNNVYTKRSVGQYVYHSICILLCVCLYGRSNMNKSKSENAVSDHTEHVSHETPRRSHSVSTANDNVNFNANGKHVKTAKQSRVQSQMKGSVKEPNKFHIYETEKITRKASDVAEYMELFGSFTRDRHA